MKKPSIKDIAKEAGVTISTVSHVLNSSKFVTEATTEKVIAAVEKLGYRPNRIARSLRTKNTEAVGVIVPDILNPFYAYIIQEMERVAREREYTLMLGCTFYKPEEEMVQIDAMLDHFLDGIIFFGGYDFPEHIKYVQKQHLPAVSVDREVKDPDIPAVLVDNVSAMQMAVDHLVEAGHREIGFVSFSYENQTTVRRRYEGYLQGLEKHEIRYNPDFVILDERLRLQETAGTYDIAKKYFQDRPVPTSFVTISDVFSFGLIRALKELGYRVPEDVSVTGFLDNPAAQYMEPGLTTVVQPTEKMGNVAMNLLLDLIEKKKLQQTRVVLEAELSVRDSVAPPQTAAPPKKAARPESVHAAGRRETKPKTEAL